MHIYLQVPKHWCVFFEYIIVFCKYLNTHVWSCDRESRPHRQSSMIAESCYGSLWLRHAKHSVWIQPLNMEANISAWLPPPPPPPPPTQPTHPCRLQAGNPQEAFCCSFIRLLRNKGHAVSPTQGWSKDPHPSIHPSDSVCSHFFFFCHIIILYLDTEKIHILSL